MLRTRPSCFGRSSISASGEFREMQQRLILQKTLEECEQDDCDLNFSEAVEYEDEDSYNIEKDGVLLKHGLHTSLFHWLLHSMPGQSRQKLPSIVVNKIDNQSCWALVRPDLLSVFPTIFIEYFSNMPNATGCLLSIPLCNSRRLTTHFSKASPDQRTPFDTIYRHFVVFCGHRQLVLCSHFYPFFSKLSPVTLTRG